jgi:hypothetical protein
MAACTGLFKPLLTWALAGLLLILSAVFPTAYQTWLSLSATKAVDESEDDSEFDPGIAAAILLASNTVIKNPGKKVAFIGEISLDGSVRAVRGIVGKLLAGREKSITGFFIPNENHEQA